MSARDRGQVADGAPRPAGYFAEAQRPLHILAFLLPLLLAYELGALLYLSGGDGAPRTIAAWGMLARFFEMFGAFGFHLPAALLVTVLVIWHVLQRDPWRVRTPVLAGMAMEACLWTVPLTILLIVLQSVVGREGSPPAAAVVVQAGDAEALRSLPWQARLTISAGAGLYEELLFRMIGIAAVHAVLVDVMRLSNRVGGTVAVAVSAGAFALYHIRAGGPAVGLWGRVVVWGLATGGGGPGAGAGAAAPFALYHIRAGGPAVGLWWLLPYFVAGVYFGVLYLTRGFGLVVGVHFLYDVVALLAAVEGPK